MSHIKHKKSHGFTLIEMVVATAIFAVVGVLAYGGLNYILTNQQHIQDSSKRLKDLQLTFQYLSKDINQIVDRSILDQYGDSQGAFIGDDEKAFSFTHSGLRNPPGLDLQRSKLQRVAYELSDGSLTRYSWGPLDGAIAEDSFSTNLLDKIDSISIRYLDQANQWYPTWPALNTINPLTAGIPKAVEITIVAQPWGEIKRLFTAPTPISINQQT